MAEALGDGRAGGGAAAGVVGAGVAGSGTLRSDDEQRTSGRELCARAGLTILVAHADGSTTSLLTYPRNLSAGGVSFLSGVELPEGTRCAVQYVTASGRRVLVRGAVRWSTPVVGRIHRVGMAFDRPLDEHNLAGLLH